MQLARHLFTFSWCSIVFIIQLPGICPTSAHRSQTLPLIVTHYGLPLPHIPHYSRSLDSLPSLLLASSNDPSLSTDSFCSQLKTFLFLNYTLHITDFFCQSAYKSTFYFLSYDEHLCTVNGLQSHWMYRSVQTFDPRDRVEFILEDVVERWWADWFGVTRVANAIWHIRTALTHACVVAKSAFIDVRMRQGSCHCDTSFLYIHNQYTPQTTILVGTHTHRLNRCPSRWT